MTSSAAVVETTPVAATTTASRLMSLDLMRGVVMVLYAVFVCVIALLYLPCRWFADVKARRRGSWLAYI